MNPKFIYNQDTLSYEEVQVSLKSKLLRWVVLLVVGIVLSTMATFVLSYHFETPRSLLLKKKTDLLQWRFELMSRKLQEEDAKLDALLQRDNSVYRSVLEADIIPVSVRQPNNIGIGKHQTLLFDPSTQIAGNTMLLLNQLTQKAYIQSKSLEEISHLTQQKEQMILCIPSIQPINIAHPKIRISAVYGWRTDPIHGVPEFHDGIDFAGPIDMPVYVTGNGRVVDAKFNFHGYGNMVVVDHGFGYQTRYAHLHTIDVHEGDWVTKGTIIGKVGNTGKSTGPHMHYEVRYRNKSVDPVNFFSNDITAEEFEKIVKALSGDVAGGTD
ncbi:peptidase [Bacteroidia bacterium]|nr:peptidase [Bacteroidia bacterium]